MCSQERVVIPISHYIIVSMIVLFLKNLATPRNFCNEIAVRRYSDFESLGIVNFSPGNMYEISGIFTRGRIRNLPQTSPLW